MLNFLYKYTYLFFLILFFSVIFLNYFFQKFHIPNSFYYIFGILILPFIDNIINFLKKDFEFIDFKNKNIFFRILVFAIFTIFLLFFKLTIINFFVILFIAFSLIFNLDSRISFLIALVLLIYTAYSIGIGDKKIAENLSIYAYYFLIIGVGVEIINNLFYKKIIDEK